MIYTIAAPLGVFVTLACLAIAVFYNSWRKEETRATNFAQSYQKMHERWSKANKLLAKSGQQYNELLQTHRDTLRELEQYKHDVWEDNNEAKNELRKVKRLYKEVLEQVDVMQNGLDLQQAELESLREQSELWDDVKAQLEEENTFLNKQHRELTLLWKDQRDRLNRQAELLTEKDRLIKASRDAARKQRAHLQQIQQVAKSGVTLGSVDHV